MTTALLTALLFALGLVWESRNSWRLACAARDQRIADLELQLARVVTLDERAMWQRIDAEIRADVEAARHLNVTSIGAARMRREPHEPYGEGA